MSTERKDAPKVALETYDSIKCSRLIRDAIGGLTARLMAAGRCRCRHLRRVLINEPR